MGRDDPRGSLPRDRVANMTIDDVGHRVTGVPVAPVVAARTGQLRHGHPAVSFGSGQCGRLTIAWVPRR